MNTFSMVRIKDSRSNIVDLERRERERVKKNKVHYLIREVMFIFNWPSIKLKPSSLEDTSIIKYIEVYPSQWRILKEQYLKF